jgi:hypothetical protein
MRSFPLSGLLDSSGVAMTRSLLTAESRRPTVRRILKEYTLGSWSWLHLVVRYHKAPRDDHGRELPMRRIGQRRPTPDVRCRPFAESPERLSCWWITPRGRNSVGRMPASQAGRRRFESGRPLLHSCSNAVITRSRRFVCKQPQRGGAPGNALYRRAIRCEKGYESEGRLHEQGAPRRR